LSSASSHSGRSLLIALAICALVAAPGIVLRFGGLHPAAPVAAAAFGCTILAAAFVLTWASEAAQMDVPRAFAVVVLSLIAVLPEYAVDVVFAWEAGKDPSKAPLAIANMTGANRLLVGLAWPLVWFLHVRRNRLPKLRTPRELALETTVLVASGVIVTAMGLTGQLSVLHGCILAAIFGFYAFIAIRSEAEEPHAVGPAAALMAMDTGMRRITVIWLLCMAAYAIYLVAHPFAEALVETGKSFGVSEFVLVQWVAPLASEAPEVVVAVLLVQAGRSAESIAVLISSKVNQFTLLVGCLPFAYSLSSGGHPLPLNSHQVAEVAVTGAQTLFAAATVANRTFGPKGALTLFGLFLAQLGATEVLQMTAGAKPTDPEALAGWIHTQDARETWGRWGFFALYLTLATGLIFKQWGQIRHQLVIARERVANAFRFGAAASK